MAPARSPHSRRGGHGIAPHQDSSQLANLLNPVMGIRDSQRRAGLIPVDHEKHNRDAIKQASRTNKARRVRGEEPVTQPHVLQGRPPTASPESPAAGRRGSSFGPSDGPGRIVEVSARNYVLDNAVEASASPQKRHTKRHDDGREWLSKEDYGLIPAYLQKLQLNLASKAAQQQIEAEEALLPAGMRVMEESERQELLVALGQSKRDMEVQLRGLPFVIETPSQKRNKKDVEERLAELEEALRIFSQQRVLVKADEEE